MKQTLRSLGLRVPKAVLGVLGVMWVMAAVIAGAEGSVLAAPVTLGMERLRETEFHSALRGKRLGVIAHQASRAQDGSHLIDLLREELSLDLRMIFAPEHGLRSVEDDWGQDGVDDRSGLPVYSLYRPDRKAPEPAQLAQIDVLLIDLQDVGMRYYTYPTTVALAMKAAVAARKPIWVLDRPNPLGGLRPEGLVLSADLTGGFAAYYPIPTRHALTIGELAVLFNREFGIGADLKVNRPCPSSQSMVKSRWVDRSGTDFGTAISL